MDARKKLPVLAPGNAAAMLDVRLAQRAIFTVPREAQTIRSARSRPK
jgi:hypothetical protein